MIHFIFSFLCTGGLNDTPGLYETEKVPSASLAKQGKLYGNFVHHKFTALCIQPAMPRTRSNAFATLS